MFSDIHRDVFDNEPGLPIVGPCISNDKFAKLLERLLDSASSKAASHTASAFKVGELALLVFLDPHAGRLFGRSMFHSFMWEMYIEKHNLPSDFQQMIPTLKG